jgi:hypothetical protein
MTTLTMYSFIFLILRLIQAGQVYTMNSIWNWPGENITSFCNDQSPGSFHNVTDNGFGKLNVKTFTNISGWPGVSKILYSGLDNLDKF